MAGVRQGSATQNVLTTLATGDIEIAATVDSDTPGATESLTFAVKDLVGGGTGPTEGSKATLATPENLGGANWGGGSYDPETGIFFGGLANGADATIDVAVTAEAAGTITNTASVQADQADDNTQNNSASETTTTSGASSTP